jgi:O-antigen/teichoic acid export membrane protein
MSSTDIRKEVVSVGKHSMIYVVGQALSRAVGFFMIPVYTRYISPTNYGAMDLIEILTAIVAFAISMGMAESMSRFYYAEKDEAKRYTIISTLIIGLGVIGLPVVLLFMASAGPLARLVMEGDEYQLYLQISLLTTWFALLAQIGFTYLRIQYMAKLFVTLTTIQLVVALALNIYFIVFLNWDIFGIFLSTLISQALVGVVLIGTILVKVGLQFSPQSFWRLARFGLPLVPVQIGNMLGFVSNRLFLRWLGPADPAIALAQVGIFSLGHKFAVIINRFINAPFNSFWGPRRLQLVAEDAPGTKETIARICTYALFCTTFAALLLCAGIESVIQIMADPRYQGAHGIVPFIALTYVGLGLEPHLTTGMLHRGKTTSLTIIGMISLAVAIVWNFLLIPRFGLLGAATSNLAAMVVREVLIYRVVQRIYPIPFEIGRLLALPTVGAVLYLLCLFVHFSSPYATLMARLTLASTFPFALFVVGFYHSEEIGFLRRSLRRGRPRVAAEFDGR